MDKMSQVKIFRERTDPEDLETYHTFVRHLVVYELVNNFSNKNFTVLDIGCGEGFGAYLLSERNGLVVGIDIDKTTIEKARNKYQRNNLIFEVGDALNLNVKRSFDLICALQVIEHVDDDKKFLSQIKQLLKPSGIFIVSTPNKMISSPKTESPLNPFHKREYLLSQFSDLLASFFSDVKIVGLHGSEKFNKLEQFLNYESPCINKLKKMDLIGFRKLVPKQLRKNFWDIVKRLKFYKTLDRPIIAVNITKEDFSIIDTNLETALDFIGICKK